MTDDFETFWSGLVSPDELGARFTAERAWLAGKEQAYKWADATWSETLRQTREANQYKIDALVGAICDAGYTWTPEMRIAYEMPPCYAAPKNVTNLIENDRGNCLHIAGEAIGAACADEIEATNQRHNEN